MLSACNGFVEAPVELNVTLMLLDVVHVLIGRGKVPLAERSQVRVSKSPKLLLVELDLLRGSLNEWMRLARLSRFGPGGRLTCGALRCSGTHNATASMEDSFYTVLRRKALYSHPTLA